MPINFLHDVDINGEIKGDTLNIDGAADITGNITGLNGSLTTTSSYYQLNTPSGYIQMGAMNTGHAHMYTDRPDFYFNKAISINGANVLTTANTDAYFQNSDVVMNENPFGGRSLYNSMINNPWFLAADRYTVTQTGGTSIANAFNGDYESSYTVAANGTATFNIDFGQHPGYPYGWIYLSFYYTHQPSSISGRVYNNYAPHTVGWSALTFTDVVNTSQQRIVKARQSKYGLTDLEITLTAPAGTTVRLTSCEIHLDRPGTQEMPVFNKFRPETIYKALTVNSTITSTGKITGTELEGTSLDINGNADISGDLVITGNIKNNIENGTLDFYGGTDTTNDAHIRLHGNNTQWGSLYMDFGYDATNSKFIVNQGGTERFKIQNNIAYFSGNVEISGNTTFKPKHYGSSDDLNSDVRTIFSTHDTDGSTSNRPVNWSSIYTLGGSTRNTLQISTNEDYSESGMWIRQRNSNSGSPQGTGYQNWTEVWTTNKLTETNKTNYDTAYTHSQAAHAPSNAEQNVQSDWNAASGDALILNKPSIPSISGLATTSYVDTAVANVIDSAPGALDTLNELAAALGDDASFSTTITNSIATKLPLAGGTMTGDIILNDNVEVEFGTGSDVKMKFDGSNFLTTVPAGSAFLIGTNGATPDDNSNKVDFGIDIGADPQISWYGDQINIGGTDMNWSGKVYESGSFNMAAWDRDLYIFTQGSTGASAKNIFLRPQAADGVTTTVAQFNGDTGTTLTGTTTINGALTVNYNGDAVNLRSTTNGQPTNLTFSTNVPDSQIGHIKYSHSNSASYGGGDSFTIGGTETTTVILADGQLMYKDGIYSKPGSGTGAGTRKDANWDTAYTHSQSTHAPTNADATPSWVPSSNPNYLTGTETIVAPASITTTIVDDTVNVSFAASTTSNIDNYLVFSSVAGSDYSLISIIPPDDMSANMSIIDNAFDASGTQAYRIYAVKNGNYSSPRTGSISFSAGTVEATNLNVVNLNKAFYIQWDAPSSKSRFVTAYNVYKHEASASGDLSESSATLIYSGLNTNYMYSVSGSSNSNFHKFWVTTTVV
jgi:hypothetical protein